MATPGFGPDSDYFSIATSTLILQESSKTPVPQSEAVAQDENGDVAATQLYGNAAGTIYDASCTYLLKSGTLNLNTLFIGELATGVFAESITVETSNGDWPKVTVSGKLGMAAFQAPAGKTAKAALPSITLTGGKFAQVMSFSVDGGKLTGSTFSVSCETAQANDAEGEPVAYAASFPNAEVTADGVYVSDAFAWTVSSPLVETQAPSTVSPQAAWQTSQAKGYIPMTRGTAA